MRKNVVLLAFVAAVAVGAASFWAVQPGLFTGQATSGTSTYKLNPIGSGPLTWDEAADNCEADGGQLASLEAPGEKEAVLAQFPSATNIWIGLRYSGGMNGSFEWLSGGAVTGWDGNQPNTKPPNFPSPPQECVMFAHTNNKGWHDFECDGKGEISNYVCEYKQKCGDGTVDTNATPPEECDDGNQNNDDDCSNDCKKKCGNGTVDTDEDCDSGIAAQTCVDVYGEGYGGTYSCSDTCTLTDTCVDLCGNDRIDAGEECDMSDIRATCEGWEGPDFHGPISCNADCTVNSLECEQEQQLCGNGTTDPGEGCDDANPTNGDGCDSDCQVEPEQCGNNKTDAGEQCDDGGRLGGDGCDESCQSECGNGKQEINEECDASVTGQGEICSGACTLLPQFDEFDIQIATACRKKGSSSSAGGGGAGGAAGGGAGGGGAGGGGGGDAPNAVYDTDIHNENNGQTAMGGGFLQRLLGAVGGGQEWPKMTMTIDLVDAVDGRLEMPYPKTAKVYQNGQFGVLNAEREVIAAVISNDGKKFTYTTTNTVPVGYDFATWIEVESYGNGGILEVTYEPAASTTTTARNLRAQAGATSSNAGVLRQKRVVDLRFPKCQNFAVDKNQACPGDKLVYIGAFANPDATTVKPTIAIDDCLDADRVTALEPSACTRTGKSITCTPLPINTDRAALVSFVAPVKSTCAPGTKVQMYADALYVPTGDTGAQKTDIATTTIGCGTSSSSRSSSSSSSSSRKSSSTSSSSGGNSNTTSSRSSSSSSLATTSSSRSSSSRSSSSSSLRTTSSSVRVTFTSPSSSSTTGGTGTTGGTCVADPCGSGGTAYCSAQGKTCSPLSVAPCFVCTGGTTGGVNGTTGGTGGVGGIGGVNGTGGTGGIGGIAINLCGDSVVQTGEECDDGNIRDFDGCSQNCLLERGTCGNGVVEQLLGEQCEPSLTLPSSPLQCRDNCRFVLESCGDGLIDLGEECDEGTQNSDIPGASCRTFCILARCSDGIIDPSRGEECDDGNGVSGDGCSASCLTEAGAPLSPLTAQVFELPVYQTPGTGVQGGGAQGSVIYVPGPPVGATGPVTAFVVAAGAAAGVGWMRKRKR